MTYLVVKCDNYDRESVAERLIAECLTKATAERVCFFLQECPDRYEADWYKVKNSDYVLWRGMEEFI